VEVSGTKAVPMRNRLREKGRIRYFHLPCRLLLMTGPDSTLPGLDIEKCNTFASGHIRACDNS